MKKQNGRMILNVWKYKRTCIFVIFIFIVKSLSYAQPNYKTYGLENDNANIIQNAEYLDDFFERLYELKTNGNTKVNIIHLGDSHIQADYLTATVRQNFQRDFGNAGRGLIVPYRVAGTNEPTNFITSSPFTWEAKRCIYPNQPLPIGIGALTISTHQLGASLNIKMKAAQDNSFNTLTLFFLKDTASFHFSIKDTLLQEVAFLANNADEPSVNHSRVILPCAVSEITLETQKTNEQQNHATIFGINLENGKDGILYHAIGINGAKYTHYNAALYFTKQTRALQPDLFIIALGTNEALGYPYIERALYEQIDKLVSSLQEQNPQSKFILVTPPNAYRKKVKLNPGVEFVRQKIIQYAVENGLAFWDMYNVMGGKAPLRQWKEKKLLRPDGIHFSKDGYTYQGDLLYYAIMKRYNQYVLLRHPEAGQ